MMNVSEEEVECDVAREWGSLNECGDLPFSVILLLSVLAGWGALFVVSGLRRLKHARSATRNMYVAKKLQHFQAWAYSTFHTMVFLSSVFAMGSLIQSGEFIPAIFIAALNLFGLAFTSQVDVIGSHNRNPGINGINIKVLGEYLTTTYLAKVVWKTSGHKEYAEEGEEEKLSKIEEICCMQDLNNSVAPRVYDVKDVVGMQGAFIGLPGLFVYLLTVVRSNGVAAFNETTVGDITTVETLFEPFGFDMLMKISAVLAFVSGILPPVLGDWETYSKSVSYSVGSVVLRTVELAGRVGFYMFFVDYSEFAGFILLGIEAAVMFLTNISTRDTSSGGRTGSPSHYILSSWLSVFFTNYRRISVDKEYVSHNTLMPTTIEFIRFISRTIATVIGYGIIVSDVPDSYVSSIRDVSSLPALFFFSAAANFGVIVFNIVNFLIVNRSSMTKNDLKRLRSYWLSLIGCPSSTVHINRDNNFGEGGITYV